MKSESENLVENLGDNKIYNNAESKNDSKVEKVGHQNYVNWNLTDLIINWNPKYSDSIHVDPNHTSSNQPIPANSENIGSIHDSVSIRAIENILELPVHSPVHASPIFTYWSESDPPLPPHDSLAEGVTPKVTPKPHNNPPNRVPNVPSDPDSEPSLSDSSLSESYDSSDDEHYKRR